MAVRSRTTRARALRKNATDAERALWRALREANLPFRVRRQHPVGPYVADFAIPACRLAIEIDGGQHGMETSGDEARTEALAARGYRVVRFWNNEVLGNIEGVLQVIAAEVERTPASP
jgi:very-short-patch-repair endonuclease